MLYCTVLCCTVLYYVVLYCAITHSYTPPLSVSCYPVPCVLVSEPEAVHKKGPTVAVVGAGHVPGMRARWETALDPASILEAKGYLTLPNRPYARGTPPPPPGGLGRRVQGGHRGGQC